MPLPFGEWVEYFSYGNQIYGAPLNQTLVGNQQRITPNYLGIAQMAYKQNGIVFALITARQALFAQARFQFRRRLNGKPGDLFGTTALAPLETPWSGGTTADLLALAEMDVSICGNFFGARRATGVRRLRPDWTTIILGSNTDDEVQGYDIDAQPVGYIYQPGGAAAGEDPEYLLPEEVMHYMPIPDPIAPWRGCSWLEPVITEILGDKAAQAHKLKFFEHGATPSMLVTMPETDPEKFARWREIFGEQSEGTRNAYKSLFLGAGASATIVGADLKQIDFRAIQAYGETRLAAAAGVPPEVIGLAESMNGTALSDKVYQSAMRRFSNLTVRPNWQNFCGSAERIIDMPATDASGVSELWYSDSEIPALQADVLDAANVFGVNAKTINTLIMGGFTPESIIEAVNQGDLTLLEHSGLPSVQLQPTQIKGGSPDPEIVVGDEPE
jgi:hypothetical protein